MKLRVVVVGLALLATWLPLRAAEQNLGVISFENSGAPAAQPDFIKGVAALHNFQYPLAARAFQRAQAADPDFALAYWGEAMSYDHAVWHEQDTKSARAVLARLGATPEARAAKAKTPREKAYLAAVETLFSEGGEDDRERRYALAMEQLHTKYPDDVDATCFYALALMGTSNEGRDVPTYMRAAALMQDIFARNPQHPGAAHYLIHAVDDSVHAPLGLRAADAYAKIAPDSPHAQHMTSHIYLALGMWDETVAANERTIRLSKTSGCGHAVTWLGYAYLQQGRFADARRLTEACGEEMRTHPFMPEHAMGPQSALDSDRSSAASFAVMRLPKIMQQQLDGLLLLKQGRANEGIALLSEAAAGERASPMEFGPPSLDKPANELLGEVLLEQGRAKEACAAFEAAQVLAPGRGHSLIGLSKCARQLGNTEVADNAEARLAKVRLREALASYITSG